MIRKKSTKPLAIAGIANRLDSIMNRRVVAVFIIVISALAIAAVNRLLTYDVKSEASFKEWVLVLTSLLAAIVSLIYIFSYVLTRGTGPTAALKKEVVKAYRQALDQSSFNPHPLNKQHEQRTS